MANRNVEVIKGTVKAGKSYFKAGDSFSIDEKEAERLVGLKVAKYPGIVSKPEKEEPPAEGK
jgi:hypothetical protein